jgi:DNA invertase Pin-like site-specific DNA recombinase
MKSRTLSPGSGRVWAYTRVSTVQQTDGESLDVQRRQIAGYAQMHGLTVARTFTERGVSGSRPLADRPEGAKLLAGLQAGDIIITAKLDRMFRSALDALAVLSDLQRRGVALHMIDLGGDTTGNGVSKLVFTILSAVAEAERDRTRERIAEVKRDQKTRGRYLGGKTPFGHEVGPDGALVLTPTGQKAVARMRRLRDQGLAFREIRNRMRQSGIQISHSGVRLALRAAARREAMPRPDHG